MASTDMNGKRRAPEQSYKASGCSGRNRGRVSIVVLVVLIVCLGALLIGLLVWQNRTGSGSGSSGSGLPSANAEQADSSASGTLSEADTSDAYVTADSVEGEENSVRYQGKTYIYNDEIDHYLFLGIDSSENVDSTKYAGKNGQSDAVFLISYDRRENTMEILAIPRDTITEIEAFSPDGDSLGVTNDHISLQYAYGDGKFKSCELSEKAVSHLLYGLPIRGYCSLNLSSMTELAELVGGVTVTVPDDSLANANPPYQKGDQVTITKDNAEEFLRYRDTGQSGSALDRMNRQITFLKAFGQKVQEEQKKDAGTATHIYEGLQQYMVTNMDKEIFVKMAGAGGDHSVTTLPGNAAKDGEFDAWEVDDKALYELILKKFYKER